MQERLMKKLSDKKLHVKLSQKYQDLELLSNKKKNFCDDIASIISDLKEWNTGIPYYKAYNAKKCHNETDKSLSSEF